MVFVNNSEDVFSDTLFVDVIKFSEFSFTFSSENVNVSEYFKSENTSLLGNS